MDTISILSNSTGLIDKENYRFANNHYLHGDVESWMQYDIFYTCNMPEGDGLFNCVVESEDTTEVRYCYWFKWSDDANISHGLVVDQSDNESIQFAMEKYMKKSNII